MIPKIDYYQEVYKVVKEHGGVCIADEVQTGLGRVGNHFWAFQEYGLAPDIVTIGKSLGNGFPISAVVCTKEIAASFKKTGINYGSSFGGNPVSLAAGHAVLDFVEKENLQKNSKIVGEYCY